MRLFETLPGRTVDLATALWDLSDRAKLGLALMGLAVVLGTYLVVNRRDR